MAFYQCTICLEDGTEIATAVRVSIESAGGNDWYGTITASQLTGLSAGRQYRLILGDGRVGSFRVKRNTVAGGEDRAISITGIGSLA